jgi:hypothetical protein
MKKEDKMKESNSIRFGDFCFPVIFYTQSFFMLFMGFMVFILSGGSKMRAGRSSLRAGGTKMRAAARQWHKNARRMRAV